MVYAWIIAILLVLILWSFIEKNLLQVTEYDIHTKPDKPSEEFTLVLLADLHNNSFGNKNEKLIKEINKHKPDAIIIAGDLITKKQPSFRGNAYHLLVQLVEKYPVHYGYGNHELHLSGYTREVSTIDKGHRLRAESWARFISELEKLGVQFLDNRSTELVKGKSKLRITGLNAGWEAYANLKGFSMKSPYLERHIGESDSSVLQLLIAHNPVYFKDYALWGADLVLSGHLHGGLVRVPGLKGIVSPQYRFFPKYDAGLFEEANRRMIVSRGLGSHSFMLRLFNPPELVVIHINRTPIEGETK